MAEFAEFSVNDNETTGNSIIYVPQGKIEFSKNSLGSFGASTCVIFALFDDKRVILGHIDTMMCKKEIGEYVLKYYSQMNSDKSNLIMCKTRENNKLLEKLWLIFQNIGLPEPNIIVSSRLIIKKGKAIISFKLGDCFDLNTVDSLVENKEEEILKKFRETQKRCEMYMLDSTKKYNDDPYRRPPPPSVNPCNYFFSFEKGKWCLR